MKTLKKMSISLLFVCICLQIHAQLIGLKAGLNLANLYIEDIEEDNGYNMLKGFHAGITIEQAIGNHVAVVSNLLLTSKGITSRSESDFRGEKYVYTTKIDLLYIDMPVQLKLTHDFGNLKLYAMAGPYIGMGLKGGIKFKSEGGGETEENQFDIEWGDEDRPFKRWDYGLQVGAGVEIGRLQLGAGYQYGLANISMNEEANVKHRIWSFSVGYRLSQD